MKRNRMSLKKANMIPLARKSATSNPFVVFGFYDTLEKVMSEKEFVSLQIWNLDEADTGRCKVIVPKGEVADKITLGAGHENITMVAACNRLQHIKNKDMQQSYTSSRNSEAIDL